MMTTRSRSKFSLRKSNLCFFLAFCSTLCWMLMTPNAFVSGEAVTESPGVANDSSQLEVIELTSKSFGSMVGFGKGEVWLIEFYTPTCSHCVNFAPVYENLARTLHSSNNDGKIRVARVNCSQEKALMTRFDIRAFPSFFLVAGWDVYEFEETRGAATLTEFAKGGYKKKNPVPFMQSPMGPMGLMQGTLIFVGTRAMGSLDYMNEKFGISPIVSGVIICAFGVFCGMMSIVLLTVLSTPSSHSKRD